MIKFKKLNNGAPYKIFRKKYREALNAGQENIEALSISSYNKNSNEVDSRFVNLKFIDDKSFIFFSNYESPKSEAFQTHNQISGLFYWSSTNCQIRIKGTISKTSSEFNNSYFRTRSSDKNALAISSKQSQIIDSYTKVIDKYHKAKDGNLTKCPNYWGGFSFTPYYFEFWEGHKNRLNKREAFDLQDSNWKHSYLEP